MKISISIVLMVFSAVAHVVSSQSQSAQQQQPPQLIRSVNPTAQLGGQQQQQQQQQVGQQRLRAALIAGNGPSGLSLGSGAGGPLGFVNESEQEQQQQPPPRTGADESEDATSELVQPSIAATAEMQVDKRSWLTRARAALAQQAQPSQQQQAARQQPALVAADAQDQVVNMLLQELELLEIESLSGSSDDANRRQRQRLQQQLGAGNGELFGPTMASAGANRLRGRSTPGSTASFVLASSSGNPNAGSATAMNGNHQVAPTFQMMPASLVMEEGGGMNSFPKRTPNRHLPCFFNAITCY